MKKLLYSIAIVVIGYRIFLCTEVPLVTSDMFRNLGWGSHLFDSPVPFYSAIDFSFKPEMWAFFGINSIFFYPPVTAFFFWLLSSFQMGIFWGKLILTGADVFTAYLFKRHISLLAAVLYLSAPVSLWYTSHEGQFEAIQVLTIVLSIVCFQKQKWLLSGIFLALGIQVKLSALLLLPWIAVEMIRKRHSFESIRFLVYGVIAGFLPFISFYIETPKLLLHPLIQGELRFNPFYYNIFSSDHFLWMPQLLVYWYGIWSYALLLLLFSSLFFYRKEQSSNLQSFIPVSIFLLYLKTAARAQFWYVIIWPAFLFCFKERKRLIVILLIFHWLSGARSALLLTGNEFGYIENPKKREVMQQCLYRCNPQNPISYYFQSQNSDS